MIFVDPLFQRILVDVVRSSPVGGPQVSTSGPDWAGLPVIFDEVFVGLYRLGVESTSSILGVYPDISVNAKILTGGLVPLAVTMASDSIFQAFYSDKKADALLHGHSYTAYPVGCEVANETLELVEKLTTSEEWKESQSKWKVVEDQAAPVIWSLWDPRFVDTISRLPVVGEVMTLGTVLSIKIADDAEGESQCLLQQLEFLLKIYIVQDINHILHNGYWSRSRKSPTSMEYPPSQVVLRIA